MAQYAATTTGPVTDNVVAILSEGPIADPSGRASTALADLMDMTNDGQRKMLNVVLLGLETDGRVVREVRGKRTFEIRLAHAGEDLDASRAAAAERHAAAIAVRRPRRAVAPPEPIVEVAPAIDPGPTDAIDVAELAGELLRRVIDAANRPARTERDLHETQTRMSAMLDENARLRRKLSEAEDLCVARRVEVDGLRKRLVAMETQARDTLLRLNGSATAVLGAIRERELRELAREMSQAPAPGRGADHVEAAR